MIHNKPRCFECGEVVSAADVIFAPLCGSTSEHDECGSAVFHPLCLMDFRERRAAHEEQHREIAAMLEQMFKSMFRDEE